MTDFALFLNLQGENGARKGDIMTEREKQILEKFILIMPKLSESDRSYLIGIGEGMAIKARQEKERSQQLLVKE